MNSEETFNEKFASVEEALKYIADSQAQSEWLRKKSEIEHRARQEKFEEESKRIWLRTKKHLDHITKLTGIVFEDLEFQNEKLNDAGKTLSRENPAIERNS